MENSFFQTTRPSSNFDAFGEPEPIRLADLPEAGGSRLMQRAGVGAFWTLVVGIVVARVVYVDPGFGNTMTFVANLRSAWLYAFG